MPLILETLGTLTIATAEQNSAALSSLTHGVKARMCRSITIYGPETLPETVTVEVQPLSGGAWRTLQSAGTDIGVGVGKAVIIEPSKFGDARLHAGGAVAADRAFAVEGSFESS